MIEIINAKLSKTFKHEQDFISIFLNDFRKMSNQWNHWFKISDIVRTMKPADWIISTENWNYYFEAKVIENEILNFSQFEPSQLSAWRKITNLNWGYFVLVWSKKLQKYSLLNYKRVLELLDNWITKINIFL